jgi:hypothetical protein
MILYGDLIPSDSDIADMSSWWLNLNCKLPVDDRSGASRAMIDGQCNAQELTASKDDDVKLFYTASLPLSPLKTDLHSSSEAQKSLASRLTVQNASNYPTESLRAVAVAVAMCSARDMAGMVFRSASRGGRNRGPRLTVVLPE